MIGRLVVIGLFFPLMAARADAPELKRFVWEEGNFSILLPGSPHQQVSAHKKPDGREIVNHTFTLDKQPAVYTIAYAQDAELAKADAKTIEARLERVRKGLEEQLQGKLLGERRMKLANQPGREFVLELPSAHLYRSGIYIVRDRFYQITVVGPKEHVQSQEANTVLESFRLLR